MKRLPIGISDFKYLIEEDYYYFDKTNFIDEIIKDGSQVKLFTRPRRFGKTLNMSMLKYFFDIKEAKENKKLFDTNFGNQFPLFLDNLVEKFLTSPLKLIP